MCTLAKILGGGLPGGAVAGKAEIINMIEMTGDPAHDKSRRVQHNGTFNANPLSAAAGVQALSIVKTNPVNSTANAMADMLKNGLNDMLAQNEFPGCASGIASMIWLRLGVDHECDREVCILPPQKTEIIDNLGRKTQVELAMMNHGVHSGTRFIVMAAHTESDIQDTVSAAEKALTDLRNQGMI
jgi:glutamate-1-semialdehyde 2,1-aminomutase